MKHPLASNIALAMTHKNTVEPLPLIHALIHLFGGEASIISCSIMQAYGTMEELFCVFKKKTHLPPATYFPAIS